MVASDTKARNRHSPIPMDTPGWALVVEAEGHGVRLDAYLSRRIARLTRSRAARLVVFDLDHPERRLKKGAVLRVGQRLWASRPVSDAEAGLAAPTVLFEDEALLMLNTPAGLAVHPTATRYRRTVTHWLARHFKGLRVEPTHRLDVETSSVLLCGKGLATIQTLRTAFAEGALEKRDLAVIEGVPNRDRWTADIPLGFDAAGAVRLKMGRGRMAACTDFRVRKRGAARTLVEALPRTGRQHQIRVHAALTGHPIVGDKLYGPDEGLFLASLSRPLTAAENARLGAPRQALHAARLELVLNGRQRLFEAPSPALFESLLT